MTRNAWQAHRSPFTPRGAGDGSELRAAVGGDADAGSFDGDGYDPAPFGQLQELWHGLGMTGDVDLGEPQLARDERSALAVAMRALGFHVQGDVRRHRASLARQNAENQAP